jgi:hypothetical protein
LTQNTDSTTRLDVHQRMDVKWLFFRGIRAARARSDCLRRWRRQVFRRRNRRGRDEPGEPLEWHAPIVVRDVRVHARRGDVHVAHDGRGCGYVDAEADSGGRASVPKCVRTDRATEPRFSGEPADQPLH